MVHKAYSSYSYARKFGNTLYSFIFCQFSDNTLGRFEWLLNLVLIQKGKCYLFNLGLKSLNTINKSQTVSLCLNIGTK